MNQFPDVIDAELARHQAKVDQEALEEQAAEKILEELQALTVKELLARAAPDDTIIDALNQAIYDLAWLESHKTDPYEGEPDDKWDDCYW